MNSQTLKASYEKTLDLEKKAERQLSSIRELRDSIILKMDYGVAVEDIVSQKRIYIRTATGAGVPSGNAKILLSDNTEVEIPANLLRWKHER